MIFAGKADVIEAVQLMGVPVLPPVDVVLSGMVREVVDVLVWEALMAIIAAKLVFCLHHATPSQLLARMMAELLLLAFQD